MIITDVKVHAISAKIDKPFKFSQGWVSQRSSVIVQVIGEDGTCGFGESMCHGQQSPQLAASFLESCYIPEVIGKDSLDAEIIWETLYNKARPFASAALHSTL